MTYELHLILALANLILCCGIAFACMCRLNVMRGHETKRRYRIAYACLFMCSLAKGFSPVLLREWPGFSDLLISGAVLLAVVAGVAKWRHGVPDYAQSGAAPLGPPER